MNIRKKLNNFVAHRRAIRELNSMDSRLLQDLGITRSDIPRAVRGL